MTSDQASRKRASEQPAEVFYVGTFGGDRRAQHRVRSPLYDRVRTQRRVEAYARLPDRGQDYSLWEFCAHTELWRTEPGCSHANGSVSRHTQPVALAGAASECLLNVSSDRADQVAAEAGQSCPITAARE